MVIAVMKIKNLLLIFVLVILLNNSMIVEALERRPAKMLLQRLDNYVVDVTLVDEQTAHIIQSFDIVSRHKEPIIPGRAKVVLMGGINPRNIRVNIGGSMKDVSEQDLIEEDDGAVIYYEIWRPIAPGERLNIQIIFDTDIKIEGFLFKQLDMNFGEPELPIDKMVFSLTLPPGMSITYADPALSKKEANTGRIEFETPIQGNDARVSIEYSFLPIPTLPFHGYWLWLGLVIMSLILFIIKYVNKEDFRLPANAS